MPPSHSTNPYAPVDLPSSIEENPYAPATPDSTQTLAQVIGSQGREDADALGLDPNTGEPITELTVNPSITQSIPQPLGVSTAQPAVSGFEETVRARDAGEEAGLDPISGLLANAYDTFMRGPSHGVLNASDAILDLVDIIANSVDFPMYPVINTDALGVPPEIARMLGDYRPSQPGDPAITFLTPEEMDAENFTRLGTTLDPAVRANVPKTLGGQITSVATQVVTALIGGGIVTAPLRGAAAAVRGGQTARNIATVTTADIIGFHGDDVTIASLIGENTDLKNSVLDYFADISEGDTAENRFKLALQGFVVGSAFMGLFRTFKFVKGRLTAERLSDGTPEGLDAARRQYDADNAGELSEIAEQLEAVQNSVGFVRSAQVSPPGSAASVAVENVPDEVLSSTASRGSVVEGAPLGSHVDTELPDEVISAATARDGGLALEAPGPPPSARAPIISDAAATSSGREAAAFSRVSTDTSEVAQLREEVIVDTFRKRNADGIPENFQEGRPVVDQDGFDDVLARLDDNPHIVDEFIKRGPLNHGRMDTPRDIQAAQVEIVERMRPHIDGLLGGPGAETFEELHTRTVERLADITDVGVDSIIATTARLADNVRDQTVEMLAAQEIVHSITRESMVISRLIRNGLATDQDRARLLLLTQQHGDLRANISVIKTGGARITSAGRVYSSDTVDVETLNNAFVRDAIARGDVDLLAEQILSMRGKVKNIGKIMAKPPSLLRKVTEFYLNGFLTNPVIHGLNFIGNTQQGLTLPLEQIQGGLLLALVGDSGGMHAVKTGSRFFWNLKQANADGWRLAGKALLEERSILDTGSKLDETYARLAIGGDANPTAGMLERAIGAGIRGFGTRPLNASDELFRQTSYRASLMSRLQVDAAERFGDDIPARAAYVDKEFKKGFHPQTGRGIDQEAIQYAREATYTTELTPDRAFVDLGGALQQAVRRAPPLRFLAPFIKVPTNLIRQAIMRTPVLGLLHKELLTDMAAGGDRRARAVGKQITGLGLVSGAIWGAESGRMTGSGPRDPVQRERLEETNWQPNSWVTTNEETGERTYTNMSRFDPFSTVMTAVIDLYHLAPHITEGEYEEAVMGLGFALGQNIRNKNVFNGLTEAMDVMSNDQRSFNDWVGRMAGSFIPAGIPGYLDLAGVPTDPVMREVEGIIGGLAAKVPGWSSTLPCQRDWLDGECRVRPEGGIYGNRSLSPFPVTTRPVDIVKDELARIPFGFQGPPESMNGIELTPFQYDRWKELMGTARMNGRTLYEALEERILSNDYDVAREFVPDVPDDRASNRRALILSPVVEAYQKMAAALLKREDTDLADAVVAKMRLRGGLVRTHSDDPEVLQEIRQYLEQSQDPSPYN